VTEPKPLWLGRFTEGPSDELMEFTASIGFD
jgi:argininosuccinate lyase